MFHCLLVIISCPQRQAEAIVVLERAALLATSMKHKQPDLNLDWFWGNLDAVQQGTARYSSGL